MIYQTNFARVAPIGTAGEYFIFLSGYFEFSGKNSYKFRQKHQIFCARLFYYRKLDQMGDTRAVPTLAHLALGARAPTVLPSTKRKCVKQIDN